MIGVVLMADSRNIADLSERFSPVELIERLNRVTTTMIAAVERNGGIVHQYVGGSLVAYWPPEKMPAAVGAAIGTADEVVAACGDSVAVSVSVADLAISGVGSGPARRPVLLGAAHHRAEATIRVSSAGTVAVDSETLRSLPADISDRFVPKDGYAELR
jgi:class 3 adenylate cyclase